MPPCIFGKTRVRKMLKMHKKYQSCALLLFKSEIKPFIENPIWFTQVGLDGEPWLVFPGVSKSFLNADRCCQRPAVGSSDRVCGVGIFIDILCC